MLVVEGRQAALGRQIIGVLRRRVLAAVDAAGVAELRRVGDRLRPGVGAKERNSLAKALLQPREQRVIIRLRRMRQIIDLPDRNRIADHRDVAGEWRIRRILHAEVRPAGIDRAQAGVGVVGLDVLLELESQSGQVAHFEHRAAGQLTLNREVPLHAVAGALIGSIPAAWICTGPTTFAPKGFRLRYCGMKLLLLRVCAMLLGRPAANRNSGLASLLA